MLIVDEIARKKAITQYGLPLELHIPIAARDEDAIKKYIGTISEVLIKSEINKAILVQLESSPKINERLAIWKLEESQILHYPKQVWVHVDYSNYRIAYKKAHPEEDLTNVVLDHIMNRRVARLKGYKYLRIVPISREANSSSGRMAEKYGFDYHNTPYMRKFNSENPTFIEYGDLADIVKMLNIKTGGLLQDGVNEGQKYLLEI
jgi:hypothetical protein